MGAKQFMQTQPSSLGAAMTSRRARCLRISWHQTSEKAGMTVQQEDEDVVGEDVSSSVGVQ